MNVSWFQPDRHLSALVGVFAPRAAGLIGGVNPVPSALKPEVFRRERVFGSDEDNARISARFCRFRIVCVNSLQFPARLFILKIPQSFGRCGKTGSQDSTILRLMDRV